MHYILQQLRALNLGCVYKYCRILNEKLKQYLNKQIIVHYTSIDPKKKANSAFLLGCYGVLYLSLTPRDALKPLLAHGQSYRPFQDATQGESSYTISLMDCLQAIKKARELGFFNFQDFNCEEYERLGKIQGGDLNWIVPGKFLAFIGPVDYSVSLFHPPELYINYFLENNVKVVIRLNKRLYDGNVFNDVGIIHYDLFFPDGSCPRRRVLFKFLQISEEASCAIAVHCKAGLGRTGSLIGCYLIKHYRMTSHEAIGWMRICRPGSVIGHQQLVEIEINKVFDRQRIYQDTEKFPLHEFGVYSIAEKTLKQRPLVFQKSLSPPPPMPKQMRSEAASPVRPQNSRIKDAFNKTQEKEYDWHVKMQNINTNQQKVYRRDPYDSINNVSRRSSGAGDPRASRPPSRNPVTCSQMPRESIKPSVKEPNIKNMRGYTPITTFRTSQAPVIKSVNDARNYLMRSSIYNTEREKQLNSTVTVTPHYSHYASRLQNQALLSSPVTGTGAHVTPSSYSTGPKTPGQAQTRRRLGRSPSPPVRITNDQSRATNTPSPTEKFLVKYASKSALKDVFSKLKLTKALRPIKTFNIENRAHREIGKAKPTPAPRYPENIADLQRTLEADPNIDDKLDKKMKSSIKD
ncbi:hypothetical protein HF086_007374 [Spodoptera exigua]|uniref:protein-tyrosine-phosphatase n=1 Tax=Spodoptera exigua TaxID=7107 RepID=A0A922SJL6_SPOEX|nr:hypothetical protein HF086_007374 [Spodoptera exigua]